MNRLDFTLPDFTRVIWTSEQARSIWEARINKVSNFFVREIQRGSVLSMGRSHLESYSPEQIPEAINWSMENGLVFLPLGVNGDTKIYSSTQVPYTGGKFNVRAVITQPENVELWLRSWRAGDDKTTGQLLHYPDCCNEFFCRVWKDEKYVDTTWPMALNSAGGHNLDNSFTVRGLDSCNILWRWLGVRTVPHLPCSFGCERTVKFAQLLWANYTKTEEYRWLNDILSWPVEWSALHGIARIKTPICEVSSRTDSTGEKYTVRREGSTYPVEGASGLVFPYRRVQSMNTDTTLWEDNGFKTLGDMIGAHSCILTLLDKTDKDRVIVDAGCGNGKLLASVRHPYTVGIEIDHMKVARGRSLYPQVNFLNEDISQSPAIQNATLLISLNRVKENKDLIQWIKQWKDVIVYSYDGEVPHIDLPEYYIFDQYVNAYAKAIRYVRV